MSKNTKAYLIAMLALLAADIRAQKIKSTRVAAQAIHYPIIALPESYKTYNVTLGGIGLSPKDFSKIIPPGEAITLEHFQRVESDADLKIKVIYGQLTLYQHMSNKTIGSIDALKGYSPETLIDFTLPLTYEITDNRGIVIQKEMYGHDNVIYTYDSPNKGSISVKAADILKEVTNRINNGTRAIHNRIRNLIDFYREPFDVEFYTIKPSKTNSYAEYQDAVNSLEAVFNRPTDEVTVMQNLHKSISFWEGMIPTFNLSNEDEKDYYFLCSYNLAVAYCLADDFIKVDEYLETAKSTGVRPGYLGLMKTEVSKRKKYKEVYYQDQEKLKSNPNAMYQRSEPEKTTLTTLIKAEQKEKSSGDYMEKGFVILTSGDTLFGGFIEYDFNLKNGKISFVENGNTKKDYVSPFSQIRNISIRGAVYFTDGRGGLRKVVYSSPSLAVLSLQSLVIFIFPQLDKSKSYSGFDSNDGASYVTNYKKKFAEVFKGTCPVVEQNALKGVYDLKQDGVTNLIPAIKDFELHCGSNEYDRNLAALNESFIMSLYK